MGAWALYGEPCAYFFGSFLAKRNIKAALIEPQNSPHRPNKKSASCALRLSKKAGLRAQPSDRLVGVRWVRLCRTVLGFAHIQTFLDSLRVF